MPCDVLGCVEQKQLCDGREDCLDGSDEQHCGERGIAASGDGKMVAGLDSSYGRDMGGAGMAENREEL